MKKFRLNSSFRFYRISIVIPTLNQRIFLEHALNSIEDQNYPNVEVIVIDGGSKDGTVELLESKSPVVTQWISEPDKGQTNALNKGFKLATGEIFGWLNSDEQYEKGTLECINSKFNEYPNMELIFGHRKMIDNEGNVLRIMKQPNIKPKNYVLYTSGLLYSDATFWKRELHLRTGELDEINYPKYSMDFDWFGRLSFNVKKWKRVDKIFSIFTEHQDRVTYNVSHINSLAQIIRKDLQKRAGVSTGRVLLLSPFYLIKSRYARLGFKQFFTFPSPKSIFKIAGISK